MCKVSYIMFKRSFSKILDNSGDWNTIQCFSMYFSWNADGVAVRVSGPFWEKIAALVTLVKAFSYELMVMTVQRSWPGLQYFQNLEYIESDCNVALFLASAVREKYLQMSEYWLQKILKPTRPWGPGLSNFCCLYNFNTAHHWEIIYLKEVWPNLASNAVCQCLQMYCFLLHSLMLSMVLWEHHLTTSENMSAIYCELSKQLQLFSFPANSLQQLLPSALQQLTTAFI